MTDFTPTVKTKLKRRPERGHYDRETVFRILDAGIVAHIGYVIDGAPFVTPTAYWREGDHLYWHGSAASRMVRHQADGVPVCLTVTHLDALVVARSSFHNSINYRCVMAFGNAHIIEGLEEKRHAMDAFVERLYPGRTAEARAPYESELKQISIIGMTIEEVSAKIRALDVIDEPEDYALPYWAGIVPIQTIVGKMRPDERLAAETPAARSLDLYRDGVRLDEVLTKASSQE
jgi:uncharacterized protein